MNKDIKTIQDLTEQQNELQKKMAAATIPLIAQAMQYIRGDESKETMETRMEKLRVVHSALPEGGSKQVLTYYLDVLDSVSRIFAQETTQLQSIVSASGSADSPMSLPGPVMAPHPSVVTIQGN